MVYTDHTDRLNEATYAYPVSTSLKIKGTISSPTFFGLDGRPAYFKVVLVNMGRGPSSED